MKRVRVTGSACNCLSMGKTTCSMGTCINVSMNIECCEETCGIGSGCGNRNLTLGIEKKVAVKNMGDKGSGLVAAEAIPAKLYVMEFKGIVCDKHENSLYVMEVNVSKFIDADVNKGDFKCGYINHSCKPNLIAEKWMVLGEERVAMYALVDIDVGDELTFSYSNDYSKNSKRVPCLCKMDNCTGYI